MVQTSIIIFTVLLKAIKEALRYDKNKLCYKLHYKLQKINYIILCNITSVKDKK